jgi:signal transduction histidine kinase/ligand-binding sensor domain-containing protein
LGLTVRSYGNGAGSAALRRCAWLLLALCTSALAQAPPAVRTTAPDSLQEYRHTAFLPEGGAPCGVRSMTQTPDGFLWIATPTGLFRFDGVRFDMDLSARLPSPSVWSLLSEPDGSLWIGYAFGGVSVLRAGRIQTFDATDLPQGSVKQFYRSPDGTLWASTTSGLGRLDGGHWRTVGQSDGYSGESPHWLGSADGRFIVLTGSATFQYAPASGQFERSPVAIGEAARYGIPDRSAWRPDLSHTSVHEPYQTMIGRDHSLWVSGYESVVHYKWSAGPDAPPEEHRFTTDMGLTGDASAMLEDREGNIWIGTDKGLDRFSIPRLQRVVLPGPLVFHPLLIPGEHGDAWLSRTHQPIVSLDRGHEPIPALGTSVIAASRGADGTLWVAGKAGLFEYKHGVVLRELPPPVTEAQLPGLMSETPLFQAIAVDTVGAVWLSIERAGLFRWDGARWTRPGDTWPLPQEPAIRLLADARHRLWIAYTRNRLAVLDGSRVTVFTAADGLGVGNVLAVDVAKDHAWIAGDRGMAVLVGGRFLPVRGRGNLEFRLATGIVETDEGELWLNAAQGVYRIRASSVMSVLSGSRRPIDYELFDWLDGVDSPVEVVRPGPSMLQTRDGRLWLSRIEGVWTLDPAHIPRSSSAPIVSVEDLFCNGIRYEPGPLVSLPAKESRNLRIDYTAASLTDPQRVRFRYRLVGADEQWQDAGQRRQAYYTHLNPGRYEFLVAAANRDGVWSTRSAALTFTLQPEFYETGGFKVLCGVLALAVVALLFIVRLEQAQRQYRRAMQERHAERERIARDVHDTLLQGVQAVLFRLQMWEEDPHVPQSLRAELAAVASQTKSIVVEGRERILMMRRTDAQPADLLESLAAVGNEASAGKAARFAVTIAGGAKSLTAAAKEQLIDIAREAVRNAYQHARASYVSVNLEYRRRALHMSVADDGQGIDPVVAAGSARSSHFGLVGMRERATQLEAEFQIGSNGNSGTRVEVIVPARVAFQDAFTWPWQRKSRA